MDRAERTGEELSIILLDWEKAFDKITHSSLLKTLRRFAVPSTLLRLIENIYLNPQFTVKLNGVESDLFSQHTGIRQGCPLSPYLFLLVMTAIWADIDRPNGRNQRKPRKNKNAQYSFEELLYADDTLLFGPNVKKVERKLHRIEQESARYGLRLNFKKCLFLGMNRAKRRHPKFADGTKVPKESSAMYLGVKLSNKGSHAEDLSIRIKQTMATWNRMRSIWKLDRCRKRTRLQIYRATITTKLCYALETLYLTRAQRTKINAFQLKGLRRILKMDTTYIDRAKTNRKVYEAATEELNRLTPKQQREADIAAAYIRAGLRPSGKGKGK
jgi:hypothetical protein